MTINQIKVSLKPSNDADILHALASYTDLGLSTQDALKTLIRAGLVKSQIVDALIAGLAEAGLSRPDSIDAYNADIEAYNASIDAHNDPIGGYLDADGGAE